MFNDILQRGYSALRPLVSHSWLRAIILRTVAVSGALAILFVGDSNHGFAYSLGIAVAYFTCVIVLTLLARKQSAELLMVGVVMLDALLVVGVLYQDILRASASDDHSLTTAGLVVPFIVLSHVSINLNVRLICIFAATVLTAWLVMLAIMALRHELSAQAFFGLDLSLALGFGFAAVSTGLLALDHKRTRREVQKVEHWRKNLARFFSPHVVADLQAGHALELNRRSAAIMFVDLRDFTSYAESAAASQLAGVLAQYRRIVAGKVFDYGGTIDKFIGDGIMAVFGHPTEAGDDAERALACALELTSLLRSWRPSDHTDDSVFETGIGLHFGSVIGGVLKSGYHDEFTVIGDAVNVAQRLEALTKELDAALVVSSVLLTHTKNYATDKRWIMQKSVTLSGRRLPIDIAYLPRMEGVGVPRPARTSDTAPPGVG